MLLILGHQRLDLRQLPDLMTPWFRIVTLESFATARANARTQRNHLLAFFRRNQHALVTRMSLLPATLEWGFAFRSVRLRVRVLTAGWQRGILRSQLQQLRFQLLNLGQQQPNNRLCFRRLLRNQFFRDGRRHHVLIAENLE